MKLSRPSANNKPKRRGTTVLDIKRTGEKGGYLPCMLSPVEQLRDESPELSDAVLRAHVRRCAYPVTTDLRHLSSAVLYPPFARQYHLRGMERATTRCSTMTNLDGRR